MQLSAAWTGRATERAVRTSEPRGDHGGAARTQSRPAFVSIRYSGPTSTVTTGVVSGRQYRFPQTGAVLRVDLRDQAALMKVPHLRSI
jgi:hypothetical protein